MFFTSGLLRAILICRAMITVLSPVNGCDFCGVGRCDSLCNALGEHGGRTMTRELLRLRLFAAALMMALIAVAAPAMTADDTKPAETTKKSPWKADDFVFTENASQFRI